MTKPKEWCRLGKHSTNWPTSPELLQLSQSLPQVWPKTKLFTDAGKITFYSMPGMVTCFLCSRLTGMQKNKQPLDSRDSCHHGPDRPSWTLQNWNLRGHFLLLKYMPDSKQPLNRNCELLSPPSLIQDNPTTHIHPSL